MGNQTSLTIAQVEEMKLQTPFTETEIKRLFRRFKKLDTDRSGALSIQEFLAIPELEHNPLVTRVVNTFDQDHSGEVDFREFVTSLSVLKAMVGSNLNDVQLQQLVDRTILQGDKDHDGKLSYDEFCEMVKESELEQKLKIEFQ